MRQLVPEGGLSNRNPSVNDGDLSAELPDPGVLEANPWLNASPFFSTAGASEAEIFQDIFGVLPDVQLHPILPSNASTETLVLDEGESSGRKRKLNQVINYIDILISMPFSNMGTSCHLNIVLGD
jgi:hypothetical protein